VEEVKAMKKATRDTIRKDGGNRVVWEQKHIDLSPSTTNFIPSLIFLRSLLLVTSKKLVASVVGTSCKNEAKLPFLR